MKIAKIPSVEITRCLPEGEGNAKSFSQIYRIFEDTSTAGASKTAFRAYIRELCQRGFIHQTDKGLFCQLPDAPHPPEVIEAQETAEPTATQKRKWVERDIKSAKKLLHQALVLLDQADQT